MKGRNLHGLMESTVSQGEIELMRWDKRVFSNPFWRLSRIEMDATRVRDGDVMIISRIFLSLWSCHLSNGRVIGSQRPVVKDLGLVVLEGTVIWMSEQRVRGWVDIRSAVGQAVLGGSMESNVPEVLWERIGASKSGREELDEMLLRDHFLRVCVNDLLTLLFTLIFCSVTHVFGITRIEIKLGVFLWESRTIWFFSG